MTPALEVTTTQTTTTEVKLKPALKLKLVKRLQLYATLRDQLKALELAMDKEKGEIGKLREEAGVESLALDGFHVTLVRSVRSSLDKMKLIEMGVTTEMLEAATVSKPGKPYERISCPGDKPTQNE